MGVFEMPSFAKGTNGVGEAIANLTDAQLSSVVGTHAAAAYQLGLADKFYTFLLVGHH